MPPRKLHVLQITRKNRRIVQRRYDTVNQELITNVYTARSGRGKDRLVKVYVDGAFSRTFHCDICRIVGSSQYLTATIGSLPHRTYLFSLNLHSFTGNSKLRVKKALKFT
jgi:hypothetical protein